jgi:predicted enzyme related to lactoylglutathione lyase
MSNEALKQHGVFSWNELMTSDLDAAKGFYGELLGWIFNDIKVGDMDYTIIKNGEKDAGGMMIRPSDADFMPLAWSSYVTVDDVDARTARAESLGGKVCVPPQDIPGIGRFSVVADQQGVLLGMITYSDKM